jgi:hypothetical protein
LASAREADIGPFFEIDTYDELASIRELDLSFARPRFNTQVRAWTRALSYAPHCWAPLLEPSLEQLVGLT